MIEIVVVYGWTCIERCGYLYIFFTVNCICFNPRLFLLLVENKLSIEFWNILCTSLGFYVESLFRENKMCLLSNLCSSTLTKYFVEPHFTAVTVYSL